MNPVLIVGCGDIGLRVASGLAPAPVSGLVRSEAGAQRLREAGVRAVRLDLDAPLSADAFNPQGCEVFWFAPPPGRGDTDTRVAQACRLWLGRHLPRRVVYLGTSAVYGDCGGAWIDEDAPLQPGTARGRRRLDAERRWLDWSATSGVPVVRLRVPGIYACERLPVKRLREGLPVLGEADSPFTNRIHADDLARVCIAAMQRGEPGGVYNVSDGHPTSMTDYFNRVAERLGLPRPPVVGRDAAAQVLSESMLSFLGESKRLDNRRLREQLGVRLRYPDLAAGLADCRPPVEI